MGCAYCRQEMGSSLVVSVVQLVLRPDHSSHASLEGHEVQRTERLNLATLLASCSRRVTIALLPFRAGTESCGCG